MDFRSN